MRNFTDQELEVQKLPEGGRSFWLMKVGNSIYNDEGYKFGL